MQIAAVLLDYKTAYKVWSACFFERE